jgi:hypothetical protein
MAAMAVNDVPLPKAVSPSHLRGSGRFTRFHAHGETASAHYRDRRAREAAGCPLSRGAAAFRSGGALIAEVAKRHKILLDPDDPAFALITINEIVLSRAIAIVEATLEEMEQRLAHVSEKQTETAKAID